MNQQSVLCVVVLAAVLLSADLASARRGPPPMVDYYGTLDVPRDADDDAIKKSFKKLTRKYHPDRQRDATDEERAKNKQKFMEVADAYEVLSDAKKRKEYDSNGGRHAVVTAGDDFNYLKANLFNDDFDGDQIGPEEIDKALSGKSRQSLFVMFWSENFPSCVDAGIAWKELARRLKGSTVRVASYKCDSQPQKCHQMKVGQPPRALMFAARTRSRWETYQGKFEPQLLIEYAVDFLRTGNRLSIPAAKPSILEKCPNPAPSIKWWAAPYFFETSKRSYVGENKMEFVAFQYDRCYDCNIELAIAIESLYPVMPKLLARNVDCMDPLNKEWCQQVAPRDKNRAIVVMGITQRCWYATKKPYVFSNEKCEEPKFVKFEGRFQTHEYVNFILSSHESHIKRLSGLRKIEATNDAYAVLYTDGPVDPKVKQHWEILARRVNTVRPVIGAKGFKVVIASIDCSQSYSEAACNTIQGKGDLPLVALYSFGLRAKKTEPTIYNRIGSGAAMLKLIQNDMEPLHLHQLEPKTYNTKINAMLNKGKRWFILFNAGNWCPPCNQIRSQWPRVARIIQNNEAAAKRLNVGVVECDKYKKLCGSLGIQNYPSMMYLAKGRPRSEYNGNREAQAMADWAIDAIDNRMVSLDFQDLQASRHGQGPTTLVSFTAGEWCPPCTQLKPTFKKVANSLTNIRATQIDCDEEQRLCMQFGIEGYPTVQLFHKGKSYTHEGYPKTAESIIKWAKELTS